MAAEKMQGRIMKTVFAALLVGASFRRSRARAERSMSSFRSRLRSGVRCANHGAGKTLRAPCDGTWWWKNRGGAGGLLAVDQVAPRGRRPHHPVRQRRGI